MVSIITINYNGYQDTCEMIESLHRHETYPHEIIVVDNASKGNDAEIIRDRHPEVTVIAGNKNLGFAGGCNLGTRQAKGDYILYLNNDVLIDAPFLKAMVDRMNSSPKVGLVSGKLMFNENRRIIQYAGYSKMQMITIRSRSIGARKEDHGQYDTACVTGSAHGACMLTSRKIIEEVGMITEIYFLFYEEIDWSMCIQRAGYEIWYEPKAKVYHKEGMSINTGTPLRNYYLTRSRTIFTRRNNKFFMRFLSCFYLVAIAWPYNALYFIRKKDWANLKAISKGRWEGLTINKNQ